MSEDEKPKPVRPKIEHVALLEFSSRKIDAWIEQVQTKKRGVKISRKDFVNWLIAKSPENLNSSDFTALVERFYDEAAFLRQLLRDVKQAKADGKTDTGFDLVVKARKLENKKDLLALEGGSSRQDDIGKDPDLSNHGKDDVNRNV